MPRCWRGRCLRCRAACCWHSTNGTRCLVPSIMVRHRLRSPRRLTRLCAGWHSSAVLSDVAAETSPGLTRCGVACNTSWTSPKCIVLCGQSRLCGPNHPKRKNVSNTQAPHVDQQADLHGQRKEDFLMPIVNPLPKEHAAAD